MLLGSFLNSTFNVPTMTRADIRNSRWRALLFFFLTHGDVGTRSSYVIIIGVHEKGRIVLPTSMMMYLPVNGNAVPIMPSTSTLLRVKLFSI